MRRGLSLITRTTDKYPNAIANRFFCAIEPTQRPMWAQKMREILCHPGDKLITLMFPLGKEGIDGPPFSVSHKAYAEVLAPHFRCIQCNAHCRSDPSRQGMESLVIWERSS